MVDNIITDKNEARRFARVIVSDIAAYNSEKVESGILNDNLFELLAEELEEGEVYYRSRVERDICDKEAFLDHAIVDILIKPKSYIESPIW